MSLLLSGIIAAGIGTTLTIAGGVMKGIGDYNDAHKNDDEEEDDDDEEEN